MRRKPPKINSVLRLLAAVWFSISFSFGAEHSGRVMFSSLPVPGASITATQGEKKLVSVTDQQGIYAFAELADGIWTVKVEMTGFAVLSRQIIIAGNLSSEKWELTVLPFDQIKTEPMTGRLVRGDRAAPPLTAQGMVEPTPQEPGTKAPVATPPDTRTEEESTAASDGFLINGSSNNGAASPFAQLAGFGNNRSGRNGLYNGGIGIIGDSSLFDARSFSLTGQETPKPDYSRFTGVATLGGPLRIPHLLKNGPMFFMGYQWTRNRDASATAGLMPTVAQRSGDLSQTPGAIIDPVTAQPFSGNIIPQSRLSPQALALLSYYPLPNFTQSARYNYQIPLVTATHQDALQSRINKAVNQRTQVYGGFAFQDVRSSSPSLFDFLDTSSELGLAANVNVSHRFGAHAFLNLGYQFSRLSTGSVPYFENRENVSGNAGITGNNQEPVNWGPPGLSFASGITGLSDALPSSNHNQSSAWAASLLWIRGRQNITIGGDFRRQQFNYLSQQNPRGDFSFTGAASNSDFADFLLGVPDASAIAFGNADKYFRQSVYDAYVTDDWRISPELTVNAGLRWEYGAPITELYGRLVNLDIIPEFDAVAPVVANDPVGALTDVRYPASLIRPDKLGIEPRIGIAWRPISGSSLVVRAGFGIYDNTSVYQNIATQMAQQSPLSKSLNVENSPDNPLTLANGFNVSPTTTPNTYAVDPNFRVGYAQNWQASIQRDLPGSLQLSATYLGVKGTRGQQEFLPNTFPRGFGTPCPTCPLGFVYLSSNGNSTRESGQIQLRRRLHNGFTGTLQYTFSKSIDDDSALGGQGFTLAQSASSSSTGSPGAALLPPIALSAGSATIAQNWLDLGAERSLSSFDQRHLVTAQLQYTTGMGVAGGTLVSGWTGAIIHGWTFAALLTAGSGLPESPILPVPVSGTGVVGSLRPDYTGAPLYSAPAGLFLNPAAYAAPLPGEWGNAGRNTITGPSQFSLNASMGRTFRMNDRLNLDLRIDSVNVLNHVAFTSWNTTVTNAQFGSPVAANQMRSMQITLRLRF
jgi:trimeric autotransporter adhesin